MTNTLANATTYLLPEKDVEAVKSGAINLALSSPTHDHHHHPLVGDHVKLDFVGKTAKFNTRAICTLRARVYLTAQGLTRVVGPFGTDAPIASGDGETQLRLLHAAELASSQAAEHLQKLALACGYADSAAMWKAQKALRLDKQHRAVREVIGWRLV